ncbi:putative ribonuclease D [Succinatimonas hippei YIT 12066]|uniref:Putative ribonuclease D n=2 Tax=Succinatimonas TaxID=674963 RepID=E8LLV6_SUCHY|nr:putative ribonuclease D [Succinatimonas hippei YIT 12066]
MIMQEISYIKVDEKTKLDLLIDSIRSLTDEDFISLDTEFVRINTLFPILGLLQLRFKNETYLVDPVALNIKDLVRTLTETKAAVLIFSGDEDLEILVKIARDNGFASLLPQKVYDLQLLAAFDDFLYGKGLNAYVKELVGAELEKDCTRTDWLYRPLSENQLIYAALDVEYLEEMYKLLYKRIDEKRFSYFLAEMELKKADADIVYNPQTAYRQIKGAGLLKNDALTRLQYLCQKRLEFALKHDIALNHVITTGALCDVAKNSPLTLQGLASCGVKWGAIRQHGAMIIEWIKESLTLPERSDLLLPINYFAHKRELKDAFKRLKRYLEKCAHDAGIAPELLAAKKYVYDYFLKKYLNEVPYLEFSWRKNVVADINNLNLPKVER